MKNRSGANPAQTRPAGLLPGYAPQMTSDRTQNEPESIPSRPIRRPYGKAPIITLFLVSLVTVIGITGLLYVNHLLGLVNRPETPRPSLPSQPGPTVQPTTCCSQPVQTRPTQEADEALKEQKTLEELEAIPYLEDRQIYNVLLLGLDKRPGATESRSDTMIILTLNKSTKQIHLTSLMRAMKVSIPGHSPFLLNSAFQYGGIELLKQTIARNFRLQIDDYIQIDFSGFTRAIDQVGGLQVDLTAAEATYLNKDIFLPGTHYQPGVNLLDGQAALTYARIRYIDDDFKRTGRQRKVVELLIDRAKSLNIAQLTQMAKNVLPYVTTNLDNGQLLSLVAEGYKARSYPVSQMLVPEADERRMVFIRGAEAYELIDIRKVVDKIFAFMQS